MYATSRSLFSYHVLQQTLINMPGAGSLSFVYSLISKKNIENVLIKLISKREMTIEISLREITVMRREAINLIASLCRRSSTDKLRIFPKSLK